MAFTRAVIVMVLPVINHSSTKPEVRVGSLRSPATGSGEGRVLGDGLRDGERELAGGR